MVLPAECLSMKRQYCGYGFFGMCLLLISSLGCTKARLSPSQVSIESVSTGDDYYLSAPKEQVGPKRYIFFVDMTHSMVSGSCTTDVNNENEPADPKEFEVVKATTPGLPCISDKGIDPNADRLAIISKWLNELAPLPDTKVILMPFTGGIMESNRLTAFYGGGLFGMGSKPEIGGFVDVKDDLRERSCA